MYNDKGKNKGNATIGWGHLIHKKPIDGKDKREIPFKNGISEAEAQEWFDSDKRGMESVLNNLIGIRELDGILSQNQFDALFSITFNSGPRAATQILNMVVKGRGNDVFDYIENYYKKGDGLGGLIPRRIGEALMFQYGGYGHVLWPPIMVGPN